MRFTKQTSLAALLSTGLLLSGCASPQMNETRMPHPSFVYQKNNPTSAHYALDIEQGLGAQEGDTTTLDTLLTSIERSLTLRPAYTREQALLVLSQIAQAIRHDGYKTKKQNFLYKGLRSKKLDCDLYSLIYLGVAERCILPLSVVDLPGHWFIRWHFSPDEYLNWETTSAQEISDLEYLRLKKIPSDKMRELSRDEALAYQSETIGKGIPWIHSLLHTARWREVHERAQDALLRSYIQLLEENPELRRVYQDKSELYILKGELGRAAPYLRALELTPSASESVSNSIVLKHD
ncbi:hypothetical protein HYZ97_02260 [Candidatus Pacearchaeota archaeon]|nr:hypothetical protein [Candidatus Pacearchaeota archaeon]